MMQRTLDTLARHSDALQSLSQRMTTLEIQTGSLIANEQCHYGHVMQQLDRCGTRLDRIERRLDLIDLPAA